MLTKFHKEMLDEILNIREFWMRDDKIYSWNNPDEREIIDLQNYRIDASKNYFKYVILDWLDGIVGTVRFETFRFKNYFRSDKKVIIHSVGITNNLGSIDKKGVLNKVYLCENNPGEYIIRTHKARTDKNYLSPFDTNFLSFFQECMDYLNV